MKLYKLTNSKDQTGFMDRAKITEWGENVTHKANGGGKLCSPGWIHAYEDPLLAILLNPIHGNFDDKHLWECEGEVGKSDGLKVGCTSLTTLKRINIPEITAEQKVKFAILCALEVYQEKGFMKWANDWLSDKDRTNKSARAAHAAHAAHAAAYATYTGSDAAAYVGRAVAYATYTGSDAAACVGRAAAYAAAFAGGNKKINLIEIAKKSMED